MTLLQTQNNSFVVTFDEWMDRALYDPKMGYYTKPERQMDAAGDFITAPEISFLFGACLAHHCLPVLKNSQQPCILELGAGSGKLAIDILKELEKLNQLPEKYLILERSGSLRKLQQENLQKELPKFFEKISWLDNLPENEVNFFEGVIISNEVCDALPVKIFKKKQGEILECCVEYQLENEQWVNPVWVDQPATEILKTAVLSLESELGEFAEDYQSEICLILKPWVKALSGVLNKGMIVMLDYGYSRADYYSTHRSLGTLLCYYQHKAYADPLVRVGQQDMTAHVDFTRLAEVGIEAGLDLLGYTTQMMFLADLGIQELSLQIQDLLERRNALMKLMHPDLMGEMFKAMSFGKGLGPEVLDNLKGFSLRDLQGEL